MIRRRKILAALLLIIILTAVSFSPSLNNDFVNYDDTRFILNNKFIRGLSFENIKDIFTRIKYEMQYIPCVWLTFAIEYSVWELWAPGYHAVNLAFHLANSLLVFYFILRLTKSVPAAFVVGILFGIHPLHVESVAWVTERKDVLSTFFFLTSLICYVSYVQSKNKTLFIFSILIFILGILSKPMVVTLAIIIVLIDYLLRRPLKKDVLLEKIPFFLPSLAIGIVT